MANLGNNVKTAFFKSLEALGDAASSVGVSAKQKLSEMRLVSRRDELRKEIPALVLKLWKEGAQLPEELTALLTELSDLEEQLAAQQAKPEPAADNADQQTPTAEEAVEELGDKVEDALETVGDFVESKVDAVKDAVESKLDSWINPKDTPEEQDQSDEN